jgi:hypothetical protein
VASVIFFSAVKILLLAASILQPCPGWSCLLSPLFSPVFFGVSASASAPLIRTFVLVGASSSPLSSASSRALFAPISAAAAAGAPVSIASAVVVEAASRSSQFVGTGSRFSSGFCPEVPAFSAISVIAVRCFADPSGMFRLSIAETAG